MNNLDPLEAQKFFAIYIGGEGHILQEDGLYVGGQAAGLSDLYFDYKLEHGQHLVDKWEEAGLSVTLAPYNIKDSMYYVGICKEYAELREAVGEDEKAWETYNRHADANTIEIQVEVYRCSQYGSYEESVEGGGNRMLDIDTTDRGNILSLLNCIAQSCDAFDGDWCNDLTYWVTGDIYMEDATPSEVFAAIDCYDPNNPAIKVRPRVNLMGGWTPDIGFINYLDTQRWELSTVVELIDSTQYVPMPAEDVTRLTNRMKEREMSHNGEFKFGKISTETFAEAADKFFKDQVNISTILSTPGVLELLQEHWNNDILDFCKESIEEELISVLSDQVSSIDTLVDWIEGSSAVIEESRGMTEFSPVGSEYDADEGIVIKFAHRTPTQSYEIVPGTYKSTVNEYVDFSVHIGQEFGGEFLRLVWGDELFMFRKTASMDNVTSRPSFMDKLSIVFSGFRNSGLKEALVKQGHGVTTSVSKKTSLLVTVTPKGGASLSAKLSKALHLGIPVISPETLKQWLNIEDPASE
jgi:hypothetical protein